MKKFLMELLETKLFVFFVVSIVYPVFGRLPFAVQLRSFYLVAYFVFYRLSGVKEKIIKNIGLIRPELSRKKKEKAALENLKLIAYSCASMIRNRFVNPKELVEKLDVGGEGFERFLADHKAGKNIVAVIIHLGPIDLLGWIISYYGLKTYIPNEPIRITVLSKITNRSRGYIDGAIFEEVERGKTLEWASIQMDQERIVVLPIDITKADGVLCQIGNGEAEFAVGSVKLALEKNATVYPVLSSWMKIKICLPFELVKTENNREDTETNLRRLFLEVFAPHIQKHYKEWLRLPWIDLKPSKSPDST